MTRLLIRTYRDPYAFAAPEDVLERDQFGGNNNGNLLFSDAAVKALSVEGVEVTCQPLDVSPMRPEQVNEEFDHVVFPLANAFRASFRERLEAHTRFIERLTIPVTVLGIGAQSDIELGFDSLAGVDETVTRFVSAVLDRGPAIGVRGEFTASYLRHLGFTGVEVIGCPSMFLNGRELSVTPPDRAFDESSRVAFNLTPKLDQAQWLAQQLVERYPRLTYFPQHKKELELVLWGREDGATTPRRATPSFTDLAHPLFTTASTHVHVHPLSWIRDLAGFDFSLGTRIHGNVAALLAGTPAHLLAADSRTRELADYFELPWTRLVDLPEQLDLNTLTEGHDYTAVTRGHEGRFETYTGFLAAHGLAHRWQEGRRSTWDARVAGQPLPAPAVSGPQTPIDLVTRLGWVKRQHAAEVARLRRRVRRQDAQLQELELLRQRVDRLERSGLRSRLRQRKA